MEKLHKASRPRSWVEETQWRPCGDFQRSRRGCCALRCCDLRFDVLLRGGQGEGCSEKVLMQRTAPFATMLKRN